MTRRLYLVVVLLLLGVSAAHGDSLEDVKRACFERANLQKGIHWLEECVQETFTAEPFHITLTSVAPGAGTAALGPGFGMVPRINHLEFLLAGAVAVSADGSTIGQAQATFAFPTRGLTRLDDTSRSATQKYGLHALDRKQQGDPVDTKLSVTLRIKRFDAREQDFYGLGPNTVRSALASYGLMLTETYAGFNNPLTSWSSLGFDFSFLQPRVTSSINSLPAIRAVYSEATAPGLTVRDDYLHYEPYLTFRIPPRRSYFTTLRAGYAFYQAMGDPRLSFQRLSGSSDTSIPLWIPSHNTPSHRTRFANAMCPTLRSGTRCSLGDLNLLANVVASYTGANGQVPFYFDQTLGGSDINGDDTLRGYADYRFRAPSSVLFQLEYRRVLWGPLGLLSFYDTGKVALLPSDISLGQLRHDIGFGLYLRAGNHEVARLYIAFGTGEGTQVKPKFANSF
jgi:hypothetical protein